MSTFKHVWLHSAEGLTVVEMPADYAYQLSALNRRLHKELDKLTVSTKPALPYVMAESSGELEPLDPRLKLVGGLDYVNALEQDFASLDEKTYPLIALLTEIRALQAQMEQWYEEEADEA